MKSVYSASNLALVSIFRNILERHGIACVIRNEYLFGAQGELPPVECWPQLCVDEEDYPEASRIVGENIAATAEPGPAWRCEACGEEIEGQFCACWKCGSCRPE